MEERFRKIGHGSVRFMATRQEVLGFIESELSSLLADLLEKKYCCNPGDHDPAIHAVEVEDILAAFRERGIGIKGNNQN